MGMGRMGMGMGMGMDLGMGLGMWVCVHTVTRTLEDGGETMRLHEVLVPPTGSGKRTLTATLYYKRLHDDLGLAGTTAPPCAQS